ncbi:MAG: hypothetical protein ACREPY_00385 [Rhodanobacteraceae bacterium]
MTENIAVHGRYALLVPTARRLGNHEMTITDIGILLVVLCVLLWAVMAALHRHTVQLDALQKQLNQFRDELRASGAKRGQDQPAADDHASRQADRSDSRFSETSHHR